MNSNKPIATTTPIIAITGSSGKTTTRELLASILEKKWSILKTTGNNNLPNNTKNIAKNYNSSYKGILLEFGMGKPGAAKRHCNHLTPTHSIITNIGTAHFGNLGNSIESTAKNKSGLIHHMNQTGSLFINADDDNSKLLETSSFKGELITIGINRNANYQGSNIKHVDYGVQFQVQYNKDTKRKVNTFKENFFVPALGIHNVYNALFAIAIADRLGFSAADIQAGFSTYKPPIKRLNIIPLKNNAILIDDTVNANPQSVRTAIDALNHLTKNKNKIAVLGSMLELGDYSIKGHEEVGNYVAKNNINALFTYGNEAKSIQSGAIKAGFLAKHTKHFESIDALHSFLKSNMKPNTVTLVKGSSAMKLYDTVAFLKSEFLPTIQLSQTIKPKTISMSSDTINLFHITSSKITLKFGQLTQTLTIVKDNRQELGAFTLPKALTEHITIPELPYEYHLENNVLTLGPVIGMLILPRYQKDPELQLARFTTYNKIKGLIFLFNQSTINNDQQTISGVYYNPKTHSFVDGTFPYPAVLFKRSATVSGKYKRFAQQFNGVIFNDPYGNSNKWDFWLQLANQPALKKHLPETVKYTSVDNIVSMLNKHPAVYVKPSSLSGGAGIVYIKKMETGYLFTDSLGKKHRIKATTRLSTLVKNKLLQDRQYIIQQAIPSADFGSKVDFRIYIQKDKTTRWKYSGMETKVAKKGSIISNSKYRERILPGEEALSEIYGLTAKKVVAKTEEIVSICKRIVKSLEEQGQVLGDVAIDFVIDNKLKVWILEVQPNYAAEIKALRNESEQKVLKNILPTPFEYAKALAGFKD